MRVQSVLAGNFGMFDFGNFAKVHAHFDRFRQFSGKRSQDLHRLPKTADEQDFDTFSLPFTRLGSSVSYGIGQCGAY